jgi:RHS repeat-associated protein
MSLVYNSNKFQYAVSQSLPFGEVRRGSSFNAYNCMKAYSFNGERYGYYGYDASGERTYKYGLDRVETTTNQGGIDITEINWEVNQLMLYPNGYININQNGEYTKHYYADALRIASKIGSGKSGLDLCNEAMAIENAYPGYLTDRINEQYEQMKEELWELVPGSEYIVDITPIPYPNFCDIGPGGQESALFFYHPDHLGSTGMITDNSANITQGFLYTPFGEIISDYSPTFHDSPMPNYAFNAKELDEENNMYYYSARYYAPPTFISRDPMFEKYPSISPYTYCANNPMKFVDPTGEEVEFNSIIDVVYTFCERIVNKDFRSKFNELKKSEETYVFNFNTEANNSLSTDGEKLYINYSDKIKDDKGKILEGKERGGYNTFSNLRHETTHGVQFEHGEIGFKYNNNTSIWDPILYDVHDELEAHVSGAGKFTWDATTLRSEFQSASKEKRMNSMKKTYPDIEQDMKLNNPGGKIKNDKYFILPYKPR